MLRLAMTLGSRYAGQSRLSVFVFHRVHREVDLLFPAEPDVTRFGEICTWLRQWMNVLPLDDAIARMYADTLPARAAAITFDDGYADNLSEAAPILERHGLPCTFFVASGFMDGSCMWNDMLIEAMRRTPLDGVNVRLGDRGETLLATRTIEERRQAIEVLLQTAKYLSAAERRRFVLDVLSGTGTPPVEGLMLRADGVRALSSRGFSIGAHTVSHPILKGMRDVDAMSEIREGRKRLEEVLGKRVGLFAYPNGKPGVDFDERTTALVKDAGFDAAVTTQWGVSTRRTDRFRLARFTPWDRSRIAFGARIVSNLMRESV